MKRAITLLLPLSLLVLSGCVWATTDIPETEESVVEEASITEEAVEEFGEAAEYNYRPYSVGEFEEEADSKRVLFFYATWCPSCKMADADILSQIEEIPDDVVIYKVDYDTETELKEKYAVTYQHTFVWVDAEGNALALWNGGGLKEILETVQ